MTTRFYSIKLEKLFNNLHVKKQAANCGLFSVGVRGVLRSFANRLRYSFGIIVVAVLRDLTFTHYNFN